LTAVVSFVYKPPMTNFIFNPGDDVFFPRGMFGWWKGKVVRVRSLTRRFTFGSRKEMVADVKYTRRNGTAGTRVVALENLLLPVTETMAVDVRGGLVELS